MESNQHQVITTACPIVLLVGVAEFESAISGSQNRRLNLTSLHSELFHLFVLVFFLLNEF